ncbi:isopentenyl-diphosphate Delta-isomerase [Corynebacterium freiburgense]|uniref:isopentenyl-diphosphate Delta-isomerase n=1 Tax=Corynebacterium freiburgense TaxID=556548 RepID=UPI00047D5E63|nr:isopentenyl-diphosphate Delta-isomerase [Corynebacterium freiburgense]WJZ03322.1 Isopentenyl-diphosphate Delta-isomerase [Corynebacterium freiburgense]
MNSPTELVVLCTSDGTPTGTAPKATIHTENTPLHRAFSCYLIDSNGKLLLTRRSQLKHTWPGIWTNSFCGHPGPGESDLAAIQRRSVQELGLIDGAITDIALALPEFQYRAVDDSGIVEWEVCPVYVAHLDNPDLLAPREREVEEYLWLPVEQAIKEIQSHPEKYSPWMVMQLTHTELTEKLMK